MNSEDDLPVLEPVIHSDQMPPPAEPFSDDAQSPPLVPANALTSDWGDDDMPSLMSVSDSSEEQDEFGDDDNSEWEDEDDAEFEDEDYAEFEDEDLPPLEPLSRAGERTMEDGGLEEMPALIPLTSPELHQSQQTHSWLPPHPSPPEAIRDLLANIDDMRSVLDVLHLGHSGAGPISASPIPHDVLERMMIHGMGEDESRPMEPDPERAKILIQGLEGVPKGLLVRMDRVGGAPGAHEDLSGDEESAMAGCAVCWAPLLDEKRDQTGLDDLSLPSDAGEELKIVSLPCAHVFHSACLLPWFSRPSTTTCPTCRFDIDPDDLTWQPPPRRRAYPSMRDQVNTPRNEVPIDDWEHDTDVDEDEDIDDEDEPEYMDSVINFDNLFFNNIFGGGGFRRPEGRTRESRETWTLPSAPGKTLRERIIEKEQDMGFRCMNLPCLLAPTDDDPCPRESSIRQISIRTMDTCRCKHRLHLACLVMSMRVAGYLPSVSEGGEPLAIEVSCPCCRAVGIVSKRDWDEGLDALALIDC